MNPSPLLSGIESKVIVREIESAVNVVNDGR